ncbi:MAG: hypothetical protein JNM72_25395 [Deltaproteobacteria bacterium]|nr:hypothetical protein [Deltaproteobacteria bacterium]
MPRPLRSAALLSLLCGCASPGDSGEAGGSTDAADTSGSAEGVIFKGPMAAGGQIELQPLSAALEPVGPPVLVEVRDDGGSYSATLDHQGLVRITAQGEAFNEAWGDKKAGEPITLVAYGEVGERSSLHVNLLTHLIAPALEEELRAGTPFMVAQDALLDELFDALPMADRQPPGVRGPELEPFGEGYAQAWLFGFSGVVAEASRGYGAPDADSADGFDLPAFLDELSLGFAEQGALPLEAYEVLRAAEPALNPDLAMLGLHRLIEEGGLSAEVPDLHRFLDSDQDGVLNEVDNCRYVFNPDQEAAGEGPHGAACDTRMQMVSSTDRWGCGVLAAESVVGPAGGVVCWELRGAETGGSPPAPAVYPAAVRAPWGEDSPFAGADGDAPTFRAVGVGGADDSLPWVCATLADGTATLCWDAADPSMPTPLSAPVGAPQLSAARVCGLRLDGGGVLCADRGGAPAPGITGAALDFALAGDGHLCVVDEAGALRCQDPAGAALDVPALAGLELRAVGGNTAGGDAFICGVTADEGEVRCADLDSGAGVAALPPAPEGGGYVNVAVGRGTVCAWTADDTLRCGRWEQDDPEVLAGEAVACPEWAATPASAWGVSLGSCVGCGIGADGFGACWPDEWSRARGEGEPIGG